MADVNRILFISLIYGDCRQITVPPLIDDFFSSTHIIGLPCPTVANYVVLPNYSKSQSINVNVRFDYSIG